MSENADLETAVRDAMRHEMSLADFRDEILRRIWRDDMAGVRQLCDEQIIMPGLFIEKVIGEISPGNEMNDLLYLMARKTIEAAPHIVGILGSVLQAKEPLVQNPRAGREIIGRYVNFIPFPGLSVEENLLVPEPVFRLLQTDIAGLDVEDAASIDRVFAEMVILGPGFFTKYVESSELNQYGARALFRAPMGTPPEMMEFEGRALLDQARLLPLAHPEFEALLSRYRKGKIRLATDEEKSLFYSLIDFEIEFPVYVVVSNEGRLLVYLQSGTRIHWLEYLDLWSQGGLDRSTLDFLKEELG